MVAGTLLWRYFSRRKASQAEIVREIEQAVKEGKKFQLLAVAKKSKTWLYSDRSQPDSEWIYRASCISLDRHEQVTVVTGILKEVTEGIQSKQFRFLGDKCLMFATESELHLWVRKNYLNW
ncbi:MAG: hypothetical protein WCW26_04215 [Candidatus Buchananbacteria bacterium]